MNKLYAYQVEAVEWLGHRPKAILALEMGLGKSIVSALNISPPAIIVCPSSLKINWSRELKIWRPDLTFQIVYSPKDKLDKFHYHEMLDRLHVVMSTIDDHILQHPVCKLEKDICTKVDDALTLLFQAYQEGKLERKLVCST